MEAALHAGGKEHGMPERPGERMKPRVLEQMSVSGKRVSQESYD